MHLNLTEEQQMIVDTARRFIADECPIDTVRQWEKLPEGYPKHMWAKMAEMGWTGAIYPEEYGGLGLKNVDMALLMKEIGRAIFPSPFLPTVLLSGRAILEGGNEEQKQAYLPKICAGDLLISFGLSEASNTPDAKSIKATARAENGGYVLNGTKYFVELAEQSDLMLVVARTTQSANPEQGLTMFLVDTKAAGIKYAPLNMIAPQPVAHVTLENVRVDQASVIGRVDQAWPVLYPVIQAATAILCGLMSGIAEQALEMAVEYSKERVQFEQPIGASQAIQGYLATAWAKNLAAEYMGYYAAWLIDEGIPSREAVASAKAYIGYTAPNSTQLSTQLHGGMGATADARTTPYLVWAKTLQHTLGSSRYHERVVAEEILDKEPQHLDEEYSVALCKTQWKSDAQWKA